MVGEVVRGGVAGRPQADDEDVVPIIRKSVGPFLVQRIEACEQTVDLEPVRKIQHIREHAGLVLRDVDGILLLENAAPHAVVADPVSGSRAHRVVEHDHGERCDGFAVLSQKVHLGDFFVEGTTLKGNPEGVLFVAARFFDKALRARVFLSLVAENAVIDFAQDLFRGHSRIGELETVAVTQMSFGAEHFFRK